MTYLMLAVVILAFASPASAFTCTATGCTFTANYTEPTTNTGGGPVNLTGTTVYYRLDGGAEKVIQVAPSSPAGGQLIQKAIIEPILAGQKVVITGAATAKNAMGESTRATLAPMTIDRSGEVPPNPPVGDSFK
jgi:hypothetical protein